MIRATGRARRRTCAARAGLRTTTSPRAWRAVAACAALLALTAAGCADLFVEPAPSGAAPVSLTLVMPTTSAGGPADAYAKADGVRVRITRGGPNGAQVLDTVMAFTPAADETRIHAEVEVEEDDAPHTVAVTLLLGRSTALFQGMATVAVSRGATSAVEIELEPVAAQLRVRESYPELSAYGETIQLEGAALFATGDELDEPLEWSSLDPDVLDVTADGLATARGDGTARVRASFAGLTGQVEVHVRARVASVDVVPSSFELRQDSVRPLEAVLRDANGNVITAPRAVTWESSAPAVASVTPDGVVQGRSPGTAVITAASEDAEGTATVTVLPPRVARVTVSPASVQRVVGERVQFTVQAFDERGRPVTNVTATWEVTDPGVARIVTADGSAAAVEGLAEGRTSIIATVDGVSGEARMTVLPLILVSVQPSYVELGVEESFQLTAIVSGTNDQRVTWSSSHPETVYVDETGMIFHVGGCESLVVTIIATSVPYPHASGYANVFVGGCSFDRPPPNRSANRPPAR